MAKKITSVITKFGNKRSHALNATRRTWKPNLQKVTLDNGESVRMTARELRTLNKISRKAAKDNVDVVDLLQEAN